MGKEKSCRVAIIGAGVAGLSAAYFLKKKGYQSVTLFEKSDRVGGKCESHSYEGKTYELGAFTITWKYREILKLLKKFGLQTCGHPPKKFFNLKEGSVHDLRDEVLTHVSKGELLKAIARYLLQLYRYRRCRKPGFSRIPKELAQPFATWAQSQKMEALLPLFFLPVTLFGYGKLEEIPVIYVLKYLGFRNFLALLFASSQKKYGVMRIVEGYGKFCEKLALPFDVRLHTEITRIEREAGIRLYRKGEKEALEFDKLIVACPLIEILSLLSEKERSLFSKIKTNLYRVVSFTGKLFKKALPSYCLYNPPPSREKHPCLIYKPWENVDIHTSHSIISPFVTHEETISLLKKTVHQLKGTVEKILHIRDWAYFPHLSSQEILDGLYDKMEALQGEKNTYYTGSHLCFESVFHVFAYSKALVKENF